MKRPLSTLFLALGLCLAVPVTALAQDTTTVKQEKLRKLQVLSRVYQICFGRTLSREEAAKVLPMNKQQIVEYLLGSEELRNVFAARLANFLEGGETSSNQIERQVPAAVKTQARPEASLDEVLTKLGKDHHKGAQCGDRKNSACFANWLVARVAPSLGAAWVTKNEASFASWSYAKLLEEISMASL